MRLLFLSLVLMLMTFAKAQTALPGGYINRLQQQSMFGNNRFSDSLPEKKWFISKSIGISSSFSFFNGGSAAVVAVPLTFQLNRTLNKNLYAFAGVSVAPAYVNFNRSFHTTNTNKFSQQHSLFGSNQPNIYSSATIGLMYVNDKKTFSISGSISVEKSSYPMMPFFPASAIGQQNVMSQIR